MELNKDCVRDVLLCCERLLKMNDNGFMNDLSPEDLQKELQDYQLTDITYTVLKLEEADLLNAKVIKAWGNSVVDIIIYDITFEGHEFLDNIRDDSNWKKVKDAAKAAGAFSINMLTQIAIGVMQSQIIKTI